MKVYFRENKIDVNVKEVGDIGKFSGLMFRRRNTGNLLFNFKRDVSTGIHSWFVFFEFLAVWLDENDKVIGWEIVRPFRFSVRPSRKFMKLIEIPLNGKNREIVNFIVGNRKI